jgi:hypothetical protein
MAIELDSKARHLENQITHAKRFISDATIEYDVTALLGQLGLAGLIDIESAVTVVTDLIKRIVAEELGKLERTQNSIDRQIAEL